MLLGSKKISKQPGDREGEVEFNRATRRTQTSDNQLLYSNWLSLTFGKGSRRNVIIG